MKRVLAIILTLILTVCAMSAYAQDAQTRENTILIEGMEETITETLYESANGFAIWYPADTFAIAQEYGNDVVRPADEAIEGVSLMVVPVDIPVEEAEPLIHEATGGYMEGEAEIGEIVRYQLESGLDVKSVEVLCEDAVNRFYLITGSDQVYCLTATFPLEALEGFGIRIDRIVSTFEVLAD